MSAGLQEGRKVLPYGYKLKENVVFYLESGVLINHSKIKLKRIELRTTMRLFLAYLLNNRNRECISDDEIMATVWENNNLRASSNRLWQVSRDLKYKLLEIGLGDDLFSRKERKGFTVNREMVLPIYIATEEMTVKNDS